MWPLQVIGIWRSEVEELLELVILFGQVLLRASLANESVRSKINLVVDYKITKKLLIPFSFCFLFKFNDFSFINKKAAMTFLIQNSI